jgi:hypothetical protein
VRGYVARSSCGANCAGFTKMDMTVRSFSARDLRTTIIWVNYGAQAKTGHPTERHVAVVESAHGRDESYRFIVSASGFTPLTKCRDTGE